VGSQAGRLWAPGHATAGATANAKLTFNLDHPVGAYQSSRLRQNADHREKREAAQIGRQLRAPMGKYSDRVRADIESENAARRIIYLIFALLAIIAVFLLGGIATVVILGLVPALVLIAIIEIYSRIRNWSRLRAAEDDEADDNLRPEDSK
jgi:hypothetical protein